MSPQRACPWVRSVNAMGSYFSIVANTTILDPPYILSVPLDVLEHHIFANLSPSSLVCCALTCLHLRKALKEKGEHLQEVVLDDIFRTASFSFLVFFQKTLKYPTIFDNDGGYNVKVLPGCIKSAAEGMELVLIS